MKSATLKMFVLAAVSGLAVYGMPAAASTVDATQVSFQYNLGQAGITSANNRHVNTNALGADTGTFRSLGKGGAAVFGFGTAFSGDIQIWEATFGACTATAAGTCSQWPEKVSVFAGNAWDFGNPDFVLDMSKWTSLGELGNAEAQAGTLLNTSGFVYTYLLLIDHGLGTPNPIDGFDVARVSVSAVPIPSAAWLFGSALLGLAAAARRRKAA